MYADVMAWGNSRGTPILALIISNMTQSLFARYISSSEYTYIVHYLWKYLRKHNKSFSISKWKHWKPLFHKYVSVWHLYETRVMYLNNIIRGHYPKNTFSHEVDECMIIFVYPLWTADIVVCWTLCRVTPVHIMCRHGSTSIMVQSQASHIFCIHLVCPSSSFFKFITHDWFAHRKNPRTPWINAGKLNFLNDGQIFRNNTWAYWRGLKRNWRILKFIYFLLIYLCFYFIISVFLVLDLKTVIYLKLRIIEIWWRWRFPIAQVATARQTDSRRSVRFWPRLNF